MSNFEKQKKILGSCLQCEYDGELGEGSKGRRSENCCRFHSPSNLILTNDVSRMRDRVLHELHSSKGDTTLPEFLKHLNILSEWYKTSVPSNDCNSYESQGAWIALNKPHFRGCLAQHPRTGEYMYTLGTMSFDMFPRGDLRCCIKGTYNIIGNPTEKIEKEGLFLPKNVGMDELYGLMSYNISVSFTIDGTNQRALLTNHGFVLPDPETPHRFSVWFSRGDLVPDFSANNEDGLLLDWKENQSLLDWKKVFGGNNARRGLARHAKGMAVKLLLGIQIADQIDEDGRMEYTFKRPIPGYCDMLYQDANLRIFKGNAGSIYVMHRIS